MADKTDIGTIPDPSGEHLPGPPPDQTGQPDGETPGPLHLLLDTDMDTDCDDAGALAVLHHAVQTGRCRLDGVVCDVPYTEAAVCADLLNRHYSAQRIPVGIVAVPGYETSARYDGYRTARAGIPEHRRYNGQYAQRQGIGPDRFPAYPDAVRTYRSILARNPDNSTVLCAIGLLTALEQLLRSEPDDLSPLDGKALIRCKVRRLVTMAVLPFPQGGPEEFNWRMDLPAARTVLQEWPSPILLSSSGWDIPTGERLMRTTPDDHPLHFIYRTYLRGVAPARPSWDQVAVLAALGEKGRFEEIRGYRPVYDEARDTFTWERDPAERFAIARPTLPDSAMSVLIEDRMCAAEPIRKQQSKEQTR